MTSVSINKFLTDAGCGEEEEEEEEEDRVKTGWVDLAWPGLAGVV